MPDNAQHDHQDQAAPEVVQFVCFLLAGEEYAVDIHQIMEVIRPLPVTEVPQVPPFCRGLVNCRGTVLPLFDLRIVLRMPAGTDDRKTRILLASLGRDLVGFLVDEVRDNLRLDASRIDTAQTLSMTVGREYIKGVVKVDSRLLAIMDLERIHADIKSAMMAVGPDASAAFLRGGSHDQ